MSPAAAVRLATRSTQHAWIEAIEKPALEMCRRDDFDLEAYIQVRKEMKVQASE